MSTVTVTPTVELDAIPPRVRLDVVDTGTPTIVAVTVTRLNPDGTTAVVRTDDGNPLVLATVGSQRQGTVYDNEVPYGAPVSYSTQENAATVSTEVTVNVAEPWLIHPGVPALSKRITVASIGPRQRRVRRSVYYPMGGRYPVVHTDGRRKVHEGDIELRVDSLQELSELEALTEDTTALLLNIPATLDWGIAHSYLSLGDLEEVRLVDYAGDPHRYYRLPYVVVERPEGGSRAAWTMADIPARFASMLDIKNAFPTMADIAAGL